MGLVVTTAEDMVAFRHFRAKLAMPNCAVYALERGLRRWRLRLESEVVSEMARVSAELPSCAYPPSGESHAEYGDPPVRPLQA